MIAKLVPILMLSIVTHLMLDSFMWFLRDGWQYYSFATVKEKDQVRGNSLIFEHFGVISFAATTFVMAFAHPIYGLFFAGD